jgi:hypothetical protein
MNDSHEMRAACGCGSRLGRIVTKGQQDTVRCALCDRWQYNAPRVETGKRRRTVTTVHNGIKAKQRARIIRRGRSACEVCHASDRPLHVGHIVGVEIGLAYGLTETRLNDDENLLSMCEECNLGLGAEPMSLPLAIAILKARKAWAENGQ